MGRARRAGLVLAASAAIAVGTEIPAQATSSAHTDDVTQQAYTYSVYGRTVSTGGTNIYYKKTDGPQVKVTWYKCGYTGTHGTNVDFENADPTDRKVLGTNFLATTIFCLRFYSEGGNSTDTVTGTTYWNVTS